MQEYKNGASLEVERQIRVSSNNRENRSCLSGYILYTHTRRSPRTTAHSPPMPRSSLSRGCTECDEAASLGPTSQCSRPALECRPIPGSFVNMLVTRMISFNVCACVRVCVYAGACACMVVRARVRACACACVRACVRAWVRACVRSRV